jgi:hypothetical protein
MKSEGAVSMKKENAVQLQEVFGLRRLIQACRK